MRIALVANTDWYLFGFRLELAKFLVQLGHQVTLISPPGEYVQTLREAGFSWIPLRLSRRSKNPILEILSLVSFWRIYKLNKFDLVHHFTVKCVIYGSIAAKLLRYPQIINSITGRGHAFLGNKEVLASVVIGLYKLALQNTQVIFQNQVDLEFFLGKGVVNEKQATVISGSGVNMESFRLVPEPTGEPKILFAGRLLKEKGIVEFIQAAKGVNQDKKRAHFVVAGEPDHGNPSSVSQGYIDWAVNEGYIDWIGWQSNMKDVYREINLVCLPSYGEGLPKVLIEALASGRAVVATDVPGCQEVVQNEVNGLLVPLDDSGALMRALIIMIENPSMRRQMGLAGRRDVRKRFSSQVVNSMTVNFYFGKSEIL